MRFYFLSFIMLFNISCDSQPNIEKEKEQILIKFVKHFNEVNNDEMYALFNDEMKKRNSISKIYRNLGKLRTGIGKIVKTQFIENQKGKYLYKVKLEKGTIALSLNFDSRNYLSAMSIGPYDSNRKGRFMRNTTSFMLPFKDEWYVFWGGNTIANNYHNAYPSMSGAFDFWVMGSNGKSYRTDGKRNEDYFAFGKEILAPCDGMVVMVIDGIDDNIWPSINRDQGGGNTIIIKTDRNEYLQFAHLMKNSIIVKENQHIEQGQKLGLCGNSGLSTEPHLHFQLQDSNDLISTKGSRSFFERIYVNGKVQRDYSPKRGDKIRNAK